MTRVAVTGASGFVGRHVLAALARHDVRVVAASRDSTREPAPHGSETWVHFDVAAPPPDVFDLLGRPDVVIHLAWGGLPHFRSFHHFEHELLAHYRFLKGLVESRLTTLLVTGTCHEYGMQSGPLSEDLPPLPANPYGFAKNALRQQLQFLQERTHFDLTWARLFYLFGEGQAKDSLWTSLRTAIAEGHTSFDMSGGEQIRDYSPISLVGERLVELALRRGNPGVVNVCSGRPVALRNVVETWIRENDWKLTLNLGRHPYPTYEPLAFWGTTDKLQALLAER